MPHLPNTLYLLYVKRNAYFPVGYSPNVYPLHLEIISSPVGNDNTVSNNCCLYLEKIQQHIFEISSCYLLLSLRVHWFFRDLDQRKFRFFWYPSAQFGRNFFQLIQWDDAILELKGQIRYKPFNILKNAFL
jgi:hypothetical protein